MRERKKKKKKKKPRILQLSAYAKCGRAGFVVRDAEYLRDAGFVRCGMR
jgi:hypothetical protein